MTATPPDEPSCFRVLTTEAGTVIEVDEVDANAFQLGPVLRKYTAARLTVKGRTRVTSIDLHVLTDALGLLRSLAYDVRQFNAVADGTSRSPSEVRYLAYRLTRQASAFGVRVPRPGSGTITVPGLDSLIALCEASAADRIAAARTLIAGGIVDFESLGELFLPGTDLLDRGASTGLFGVLTAMRVRACYFSRGKSIFGVVSTLFAALEFVVSVGDKFAVCEHTFPVPEYAGTRSTSTGLDCFVNLTPAMRDELSARGCVYERMATSTSYVDYAPGTFLAVPRGGGSARPPARARGGGRIMVDSHAAWARGVHCARSEGAAADAIKGVLKLVAQRTRASANTASAASAGNAQAAAAAEEESLDLLLLSAPLPRDLIWLTWPVVAGFSFQAKSWGVALVSGLHDITFNEAAFARLVLPPPRKRLIEALVLHHGSSGKGGGVGADVIAGKGAGTIFLLYGPPGVGKTLTAEAIAEMLHKPLFSISMGELGTTPEALEERLNDIIDLCTPWGALILIDEAEMLLERRTKGDVLRNAMVCVMLRLLEYYSGILFLTTNRVESLDPAFQSRVQCALRYEALDVSARGKIWRDVLAHAAPSHAADVDVDALAAHELNGRQVKNCVMLALALCASEGEPLSQRHLNETVALTTAFSGEVGSD